MTWLLRFLLLLFVFFLIQKVVAYIFGGWLSAGRRRAEKQSPSAGKAIKGQMVKDPQCGMYVASSLALALSSGDERLYFCSENCRDAYVKARELEDSSRS
jgi:YHS domain-containing protein